MLSWSSLASCLTSFLNCSIDCSSLPFSFLTATGYWGGKIVGILKSEQRRGNNIQNRFSWSITMMIKYWPDLWLYVDFYLDESNISYNNHKNEGFYCLIIAQQASNLFLRQSVKITAQTLWRWLSCSKYKMLDLTGWLNHSSLTVFPHIFSTKMPMVQNSRLLRFFYLHQKYQMLKEIIISSGSHSFFQEQCVWKFKSMLIITTSIKLKLLQQSKNSKFWCSIWKSEIITVKRSTKYLMFQYSWWNT